MDLTSFASDVGCDDPVTIVGCSTRGGGVATARGVTAPRGIEWIQADELIVSCGAATPVAELDDALRDVGQTVALPRSGSVGGALSVGRSGVRRLGDGPVRDVLLQAEYVSADGVVVKAGGPTVKNVSGFDLCRLLVGSHGTLGFLGAVILRTRPLPMMSQWYRCDGSPWDIFAMLFRPVSVLWDGSSTWALLEGHPNDLAEQAALASLVAVDGPPTLPTAGRWSMPPSALVTLDPADDFVAEIGVGIVHHSRPAPDRPHDPTVVALHARLKRELDPRGRLNPGVEPLLV